MDLIAAYCEDCRSDVMAYADWLGYAEGRDQYEIVQGEVGEDDTHITERHDLSIPRR